MLFSKEGAFTPEQKLSSILVMSHVKSRLLTERWGVGSYVSTLSRDSQARTLFQALRAEYASDLCSRMIKKPCLGQPVIRNRASVTVLACAGHFGNSLWLKKAYSEVSRRTVLLLLKKDIRAVQTAISVLFFVTCWCPVFYGQHTFPLEKKIYTYVKKNTCIFQIDTHKHT